MLIVYKENTATQEEILGHLELCNELFDPPLSETVTLRDYSKKLFDNATLIEAWDGDNLIGLVAVYLNMLNSIAFITNVSVLREYLGKNIAKKLIKNCIQCAIDSGIIEIKLEVKKDNFKANKLYEKFGFQLIEEKNNSNFLILKCLGGCH